MDAWQSGLLPYPLLLASQVVILVVMALVIRDVKARSGLFYVESPAVRRATVGFSALYATAMLVRYAVTRTDEIPVALHLVLAAFLVIWTRGRPT